MENTLKVAIDIAREAGDLLLEHFRRPLQITYKRRSDLVTEADRKSETLIVERLQSHFPEYAIVAEEGGGQRTGSDYCWYVDPLDGTTNFAHGFPIFCVTLGLAYRGEVVAGVVYDPTRDELFTVERGAGAFLNGQRLSVSKNANLSDCLVATGFPAFRFESRFKCRVLFSVYRAHSRHSARWLRRFGPLLRRGRPIRRLLGVEAQSLGQGGGHLAGYGIRRPRERHYRQTVRTTRRRYLRLERPNSRSDGRRVQRGPGAARRRGWALLRIAGSFRLSF